MKKTYLKSITGLVNENILIPKSKYPTEKMTKSDLLQIIDELDFAYNRQVNINENLKEDFGSGLTQHEATVLKNAYEDQKKLSDAHESRIDLVSEANKALINQINDLKEKIKKMYKPSQMLAFMTNRSGSEINELVEAGIIDE